MADHCNPEDIVKSWIKELLIKRKETRKTITDEKRTSTAYSSLID
jgi:hypothetical protein